MKISTIRAAAKRHGLEVTGVTDKEPWEQEDGEVKLSNGTEIQMSEHGVPIGVTGVVMTPEWTMFDQYWDQIPTADGIMLAAIKLRKRIDAHNAEHKELSNAR